MFQYLIDNPELRCVVRARSTGKQCGNARAHGMKCCRMHGARKTRGAAKGEAHWNFKDGKQTREKREAQSEAHNAIKDLRNLALGLGLLINPRTGEVAETLRDLQFD